MSTAPTDRPLRSGAALPTAWPSSVQRRALVVSKLLDAATTSVGLLFVPALVERNPFLRALIAHVGVVPGVLVGSVVVVATVVAVTELGVWACRRTRPDVGWSTPAVRLVGYVPLSAVFVLAALNNSILVAGVLSP